jgi:hypothetical protein
MGDYHRQRLSGLQHHKPAISFVGVVPIVVFWAIDAYYLAGER